MIKATLRWFHQLYVDDAKRRWRERHEHTQFLTDPTMRRAPRGRIELCEPLVFFDDVLRTMFTVPAGFQYDGGSIPALVWPLVGHPLSPSILRPTALHDWFCDHRDDAALCGMSSRDVHELFFRACMSEQGVATPRAWCIRAGVLLGGPRWPRATT